MADYSMSLPLKLTQNRIYRIVLGMGLAIAGYYGIGYFTPRQWRLPWIESASKSSQVCNVTIYVMGDQIHTNLLLPTQTDTVNWQSWLAATGASDVVTTGDRFVSLSWGDRDFYTTTPRLQDLRLGTTVKALFWPSDTVMYVQGYTQVPPDQPAFRVKAVELNVADYMALVSYVQTSFQHNDQAALIPIPTTQTLRGHFFAAQGHYSIVRTCNDWTAAALRAAKVNTPIWSGLASAVFRHLRSDCQTQSQQTQVQTQIKL